MDFSQHRTVGSLPKGCYNPYSPLLLAQAPPPPRPACSELRRWGCSSAAPRPCVGLPLCLRGCEGGSATLTRHQGVQGGCSWPQEPLPGGCEVLLVGDLYQGVNILLLAACQQAAREALCEEGVTRPVGHSWSWLGPNGSRMFCSWVGRSLPCLSGTDLGKILVLISAR